MFFKVKIVAHRKNRRSVCLVDVIAKCSADAASNAVNMAWMAGLNIDKGIAVMCSPAKGAAK